MDGAVLCHIAKDVLGHAELLSRLAGLGLQQFSLGVAVDHNAQVQQDVLKGGVGQEALVQMLLFADDFLQPGPVPGLHADVAHRRLSCGGKAALEHPHEKIPLGTLLPLHQQTFIGPGGQLQPPFFNKLSNLVQVIDNRGPADKQTFRDLRQCDENRSTDQHGRRCPHPFLFG